MDEKSKHISTQEGSVSESQEEESLRTEATEQTEISEMNDEDSSVDEIELDEIDATPLRPVDDEIIKEGIENETPDSSLQSRDLSSIREPRSKLTATNWLGDITGVADCELVKVQFKNTRVGFYRNVDNLDLKIGDLVAVEASPGHDIGEVAMVGPLVSMQLGKANLKRDAEIKRVFRKARAADLEKFEEAKSRELETMIKSRRIAAELGLEMKIGDVEYQGDGGKAIFYYIADERVDFRKLIRLLADAFKVRIEMRQIGARQEAGRIGGIGPCGRPLCCSSWMTHFVSVGTSMARMQDLSMNPQKLAGQCAKLKCCLNFEAAAYAESQAKLPHRDVVLQTKDADYYLFKADVLNRMITYSTDRSQPVNTVTISSARAHEIIALNKQGIKVDSLSIDGEQERKETDFFDLSDQDSLTRFDKSKRRRGNKNQTRGDRSAERSKENSGKQNQKEGHSQKSQRADNTHNGSEHTRKSNKQKRKSSSRGERDNANQKQD